MGEQNSVVAHWICNFQFACEIGALFESGVAAWYVEAWSSVEADVQQVDIETDSKTGIGVVAHPCAIRFPSLPMLDREINAIDQVFEAIAESKIDISITQCPNQFRA
ncbi:MAG: Uncharacterised protein [Prochlorococcus marinus str. MIT 9313]|nr:MAG: Uncharacterised protein [Prochlorococcus marinus str. MIT 9313]